MLGRNRTQAHACTAGQLRLCQWLWILRAVAPGLPLGDCTADTWCHPNEIRHCGERCNIGALPASSCCVCTPSPHQFSCCCCRVVTRMPRACTAKPAYLAVTVLRSGCRARSGRTACSRGAATPVPSLKSGASCTSRRTQHQCQVRHAPAQRMSGCTGSAACGHATNHDHE